MTKFYCTVIYDASANVSVDAETPEDAAVVAENEKEGCQHLCNQCSNQIDTGGALGVLVYNEEATQLLLDTNYKPPAPQRTWAGLTDEEVMETWEKIKDGDWAIDFYDAIEAKLKQVNGYAEEKNT